MDVLRFYGLFNSNSIEERVIMKALSSGRVGKNPPETDSVTSRILSKTSSRKKDSTK